MANFGEDNRVENWLRLHGVQFEYREGMSLDELCPGWDLVNHGRPDGKPKEEDTIEAYAHCMEGGAIFPAPIIAKRQDGFEVLDGCQRLSSSNLLGQKKFNAYIVKSGQASVRASIRICANSSMNGSKPPAEWTLSKIVDVLFEQHRFSPRDCAVWSGLPQERIEAEIGSREAGRWLMANGVDTTIKPANQKGFQAAFWAATCPEVRDQAPKEIRKIINALQHMKANNAEADGYLQGLLDVKPKKGVDIRTQLTSKLQEFVARPEIRSRIDDGPRSQHPIDNANRALAGTVTAFRACAKDGLHADAKQASRMLEMLVAMQGLAKKLIPHEHWKVVA